MHNIVCLTFTYPKDAPKAALCGALLPAGWRRVWCVEAKHAGMPVPDGVEKIVADFPRGETLRYKPAILGMAKVYAGFDCDCLIKLDSDTAMWRPDAFVAPIECSDVDFVYIRRHKNEDGYANGNAYAMSKRAVSRVRDYSAFITPTLIDRYFGNEDRVFSAFLIDRNQDLTCCQINKAKCDWRMRAYTATDCIASHYGYISFDETKGRVSDMCRALNRDIPDISGYLEKLKIWAEK
ncbi:MAG: hypothetical protein J6L64_07775 [Opitutales bacterium]|nr:hypothetical protein [Opitutales bacterium]